MEIADTTGESCSICMRGYDNGDVIVIVGCSGQHMFCHTCYNYALQKRWASNGCPCCRGDTEIAVTVMVRNFPKAGAAGMKEEPVEVS